MRTEELTPVGLRPTEVSSDDECLILVDEQDRVLGYDSKINVHRGSGLLHRAFSVFLFAGPDRVLLHRRAADKPLWPGFWTNSCCSHPRQGETIAAASSRRLFEELGVTTPLTRLYQFQYSASFGDLGSERELCDVLIGSLNERAQVHPHVAEVMDWGWFDCDAVDRWVADDPGQLTPWFKLEWARLRGDMRSRVQSLSSIAA